MYPGILAMGPESNAQVYPGSSAYPGNTDCILDGWVSGQVLDIVINS